MSKLEEQLQRASDELGQLLGERPTFFKSSHERQEIVRKLERLVELGEIEPRILGLFDANPAAALQLVPEDLAKSHSVPRRLYERREPSAADNALRMMRGILPIRGIGASY